MTPGICGKPTALCGIAGTSVPSANRGTMLGGGAGFAQAFNVLEGDANGDGVVSSADMSAVYKAISQPYNIFDDINGDGVINMVDVSLARALIGNHL